jgi:neopullulanase
MGAAEHWLRFGIDGWRLDVAEEIDAGFWREFRGRVRSVNPDAYIVAEIWREKPHWLTGDTFDALMNYPLVEALLSFAAARQLDLEVVATQHEYREFVRPMDGPQFAERLSHLMSTYRPEAVAASLNLLGSHDTARYLTVAGGDVASLRLALLAIMTLPGAPCVYYGDEIGMEGRHDPDCRRAFPWDESRWNHDLLAYSRATIAMRHTHPVLRHGSFAVLAAEGDAVVYGRWLQDVSAVVALNASDAPARLTFDWRSSISSVALPGWDAPAVEAADGRLTLTVAPRSGAVLLSGAA